MLSFVLRVVALLALVWGCAGGSVNFLPYGNPTYAVESNVELVLNPLYDYGGVQAGTGDLFIFGGGLGSVVLRVNDSANPTNGNTVYFNGSSPGQYGDVGCAARRGTNRFYLMGTSASQQTQQSNDLYYNYVSTDGISWNDVLDAASVALFRNRANDDFTRCGVALTGTLYWIGSASTYQSTNGGVTFTEVLLRNRRFSNRTNFDGGIYTAALTGVDTLIMVGGRDAPTATSIYGGNDHNDVWTSTNGGAAWIQKTAAAPWAARDSLSWTASTDGLMVIFGGSQLAGYGDYFSDMWASKDEGASWTLVTPLTSIGNYSLTEMLFDAGGFLYLFGGETATGGFRGYQWQPVSVRSVAIVTTSPPLPTCATLQTATAAFGAPDQTTLTIAANQLVLFPLNFTRFGKHVQTMSAQLSNATIHNQVGLMVFGLYKAATPNAGPKLVVQTSSIQWGGYALPGPLTTIPATNNHTLVTKTAYYYFGIASQYQYTIYATAGSYSSRRLVLPANGSLPYNAGRLTQSPGGGIGAVAVNYC